MELSRFIDPALSIGRGVAAFLTPKTLLGLKVKLYGLLIVGVIADLKFDLALRLEKKGTAPMFEMGMPGNGDEAAILCALVAVVFVWVDFNTLRRRAQNNSDMLVAATAPGLPDDVRRELIHATIEANKLIM